MKKTHGKSKCSSYKVWKDMKKRCQNPNCKDYRNYGGRGIKVCPEWQSFMSFYVSMGDRPEGLTLDRIDPDGNYCPANCRWATRSEQSLNHRPGHRYFNRDPRLITWDGVTRRLSEWARMTGINRRTIVDRLDHGWEVGAALTMPVKSRKKTKVKSKKGVQRQKHGYSVLGGKNLLEVFLSATAN
jgi:hypothetical protein